MQAIHDPIDSNRYPAPTCATDTPPTTIATAAQHIARTIRRRIVCRGWSARYIAAAARRSRVATTVTDENIVIRHNKLGTTKALTTQKVSLVNMTNAEQQRNIRIAVRKKR